MAPITTSNKRSESPKKTVGHSNESTGDSMGQHHHIHQSLGYGRNTNTYQTQHTRHYQQQQQQTRNQQHYIHGLPATAAVVASGYNTKENTKRHGKSIGNHNNNSNSKGLEILDFHESWLEELELYKDQLYTRNKTMPSQMLTSHNHLHTPQGCQLSNGSTSNNFGIFASHNLSGGIAAGTHGFNALVNADTATANATSATPASPMKEHSPTKPHANSRRKVGNEHHNNSNNKSTHSKTIRIVTPRNNNQNIGGSSTMSTLAESATSHANKKQSPQMAQLILKRPREETPADAKSFPPNQAKRSIINHNLHNNKTSNNINSNNNTTAYSSSANATARISGGGLAASSPTAPTTTTTPMTTLSQSAPKSPGKLVVKQNLANSYDDKHKNYMVSNGYSKTAATAYETSMYAASYLSTDNNQNVSKPLHFNGTFSINGGEPNNYMGVSLADRRADEASFRDDPSLAIDDVNAYSESDDDEEYQGQPFYLDDDGVETKQSNSVREAVEELLSSSKGTTSAICTTETLTESTINSDASTLSKYYRPDCILTPSLFPNVPPYLNFSSHAERGPEIPSTLHRVLKWKLSPVMPKIVKRVVLNSGFRIIKNTTDWMAIWEKHMKSPGFRTIRSHQKYNHMPGSFRIGRKDSMWRSIQQNMKRHGSKEFGFMQKSYIMPDDLDNLRQVWPKNASKLTKWIVKPPASARGTGIRIINKWSQFPKDKPLVVQKYIERPLLINESKFDMRIYVFITSINPLRIYMYKDGLARFASVKYSSELSSLDDRCMHLTNYSINKYSENYAKNEDFNACSGHKWTLQSLWTCLEERGVNTKRLWATLRNLVIKAIISGESGLNRMYRQNVNFRYNCFELFGFDVLLDENLIPWLLEINISPSLHSELPLDLHVKGPLIQAILNTALYQVPPKLTEQQQKDISTELKVRLNGPLCFDNRIFTTCLTSEEVRKHNQYTNRSIELREEYIDTILDNLLPDDVRCILITEDELARCRPLERIFPTSETYKYLNFVDNPRYYNRLLDAWEAKYSHCREEGIALIRRLCRNGYHLQVSDATQEKEPNVALTDIDMLHVRKEDEPTPASPAGATIDSNIGDSAQTSKAGSPDSNQSQPRASPPKIISGESAIRKENLNSFKSVAIKQH